MIIGSLGIYYKVKMEDQTGYIIDETKKYKRIVSLVPSQTELLADFELDQEVVGITKFCVHPENWLKHKTRIGGTKKFNFDVIESLAPDLIIANKEENYKEGVEKLRAQYPVYTSDIKNLSDSYQMISDLGKLCNREDRSKEIINQIEKGFGKIRQQSTGQNQGKVAYLIWNNPLMVAGGDNFIHDMLEKCGYTNAFGHLMRYPEIDWTQLEEANCDFILLSSEPFPFKEKDVVFFQDKIKKSVVEKVDGEFFSWYGSRLIDASGYFMELIHKLAKLKWKSVQ